jgi:dTDP-4-amino-4,6-dideoxy-D-galactose acyltransferase
MKNKSPTTSSNKQFQLLKFDTKIFGFKVARILPAKLSLAKLQLLLKKLQAEKIRLIYWQAASTNKKSLKAIEQLGGFLASKQVTYLIDLKKKIAQPKVAPEIEIYRAKAPTITMKQLAIQIGIPSRFGTDPKIPKKSFHKLYHTWIKNSVNGTAADRVLVIRDKNKIVGMITLSSKNGRGDIRLIAVDAECRGKKLGTKLVDAALNYFRKKGLTKAQVVTQKTNLPACCFYEKCGFHHEKTDSFYHFWL